MANKQKENPLLFSANISSPFDNISSAALLIPPSQQLQPISALSEPNQTENVPDPLSHSLQPHLEKKPSTSPSVPPSISPNLSPSLSSQGPGPILPPSNTQGGSFLRKPTNKYVVPPEISATSPPNSFSKPPTFNPSFAPLPPISPFTPFIPPPLPIDSSISTASTAPDAPPLSQTALGLPSNPVYSFSPSQHQQQPSSSTVIPASFDAMANNPPVQGGMYHPIIPHWFYSEGKPTVWKPFSFTDSLNLEEAYRQDGGEKVSTDGGRYDVSIKERKRVPVFWEGEGGAVMRCSWFRRSYSEVFPVPYAEDVAVKLEAEYKDAMLSGQWHRQVELPGGERVMLNSPVSMHHYHVQEPTDSINITTISESQYPQTVRRGADDFEIKEGAAERVDHLLFLIHGIGSVCDLSFRSVEECVDDFRSMGEELLASHFKEGIEAGLVGRVEILPISWHKALHGDATGLDEKLKHITLRSIPKFREFTNDTLLDILFYTSPVYCQHIMDTVSSEMDRLLALFEARNPTFSGGVSVGGHSLGSVILFDLLMHQNPNRKEEKGDDSPAAVSEEKAKVGLTSSEDSSSVNGDEQSSLTSQVNFEIGVAGTGQPAIVYPQLSFHPQAFFLMGSPVGMFITVRGIDRLGPDFRLPTCERVFNIFHPFDPVAYRVETLIHNDFAQLRPVLIPHHKGRKRMHLELKDTIERVGSDIKNKIVESIQSTWNKFYQMYAGSESESMRAQVDQALEEEMERVNPESGAEFGQSAVKVGELNRGLRVDYVLQEKPYESFTEYIFALQAHVTYWNSEDTLLMILKELYKINDIRSDRPPQPTLHRPPTDTGPMPSSPLAYTAPHHIPQATAPPPVPLFSSSASSPQLPPPSPVPLFSSSSACSPQLPPPPPAKSDFPRTLRGRPVFDPLKTPITTVGMDPTATPSSTSSLPPPPIMPNVKFNHKKPF